MEKVVRNFQLKKVCVINDNGVIIIKTKDCITKIIPNKKVEYRIFSTKEKI